VPKSFHWGKTEEPKAETDGGVLGRGSNPHQLGGLGECCELPRPPSWWGGAASPLAPVRGSGGVM